MISRSTTYLAAIGVTVAAPLISYAQTLHTVIYRSGILLDSLIVTTAGLAVFFFIWGMFQLMLNLENEEKRKEGRTFIIWSIIALTFIFALWGFVRLLQDSLFFGAF